MKRGDPGRPEPPQMDPAVMELVKQKQVELDLETQEVLKQITEGFNIKKNQILREH